MQKKRKIRAWKTCRARVYHISINHDKRLSEANLRNRPVAESSRYFRECLILGNELPDSGGVEPKLRVNPG